MTIAVPASRVTLPGRWSAPNADNLELATVPIGSYSRAQLELRISGSALIDDSQSVALTVTSNHLTPLLFTFKESERPTGQALMSAPAYGGNEEVNFGLQAASGKVMSLPTVPLVDQDGRSASLSQYRGKVVVLASFLTECQETCPLVAAALLQLQKLLNQKGLQDTVQIVEVTQDPHDDTPSILTKYRNYFALPWPLFTGTTANLDQFWSQLKVPPVEKESWGGTTPPVDMFTGEPEPYNLVHASVVDIVDPQGYVVTEMQDQPTLSTSSIPQVIYKYLDQQGHEEQRAGGSWTPESLYQTLTPLLPQTGVYTTLPESDGAATVGAAAPDFSLASTAGGSVGLGEELGHPVLIDFWATWCTNCRADMKLVGATAAKYRAQGLRVLLVDFQESRGTVNKFLHQHKIGLPSLLDQHGSVAGRYGVPGLPVAIFVTAQGKIAAIQLGQLQETVVTQDMAKILSN
jgi:cytochrome oxidase Cu insertion factor (SCO1/SenC/PrrC family)